MRIGVVSKADASGGGASRVAEDLAGILADNGHVVRHYVSWSHDTRSGMRRRVNGWLNFPLRVASYALKKAGFPEVVPLELPYLYAKIRREQLDILHFHDISSAFSPLTLSWLSHKIPVVWTLHDCSPFTAGCLYPMDCTRYQNLCGHCPQIGQWPIDCYIDNTSCLHRVKKLVHRRGRITLLAPSKWMSDMALASRTVCMTPRIVPNCVDARMFRRLDKQHARNALGLDPTRLYLLFSAGNLLDERKGAMYALHAVQRVLHHKPILLLAGHITKESEELLKGVDHRTFGYVSDRGRMNTIYAAADMFLFCSLADNQPLAVLESMASGTPIIGFASGGLPDMIRNNVTGMLVSPRDIQALADALERAITDRIHRAWGRNARSHVEREYTEVSFYENHMAIYQELLRPRGMYVSE